MGWRGLKQRCQRRRLPGATGLGGGYYVVLVVALEDVALGGEVFHRKSCEGDARQLGVLRVELGEQLNSENGDSLVVAVGGGVLAADCEVVGADPRAHAVDGRGLATGVDIGGAGKDVGGVGPAGLGQRASLEAVKKGLECRLVMRQGMR